MASASSGGLGVAPVPCFLSFGCVPTQVVGSAGGRPTGWAGAPQTGTGALGLACVRWVGGRDSTRRPVVRVLLGEQPALGLLDLPADLLTLEGAFRCVCALPLTVSSLGRVGQGRGTSYGDFRCDRAGNVVIGKSLARRTRAEQGSKEARSVALASDPYLAGMRSPSDMARIGGEATGYSRLHAVLTAQRALKTDAPTPQREPAQGETCPTPPR